MTRSIDANLILLLMNNKGADQTTNSHELSPFVVLLPFYVKVIISCHIFYLTGRFGIAQLQGTDRSD